MKRSWITIFAIEVFFSPLLFANGRRQFMYGMKNACFVLYKMVYQLGVVYNVHAMTFRVIEQYIGSEQLECIQFVCKMMFVHRADTFNGFYGIFAESSLR